MYDALAFISVRYIIHTQAPRRMHLRTHVAHGWKSAHTLGGAWPGGQQAMGPVTHGSN